MVGQKLKMAGAADATVAAVDIETAKAVSKDAGIQLTDSVKEPRKFSFTFDVSGVITDETKAAVFQLQIADDIPGAADEKLDWQILAEADWSGGRHPCPISGLLLPPRVTVDYLPTKGKRLRWVTFNDNTGLVSAQVAKAADEAQAATPSKV